MEKELLKQLDDICKKEIRSRAQEIEFILREYIKKREKPQ